MIFFKKRKVKPNRKRRDNMVGLYFWVQNQTNV